MADKATIPMPNIVQRGYQPIASPTKVQGGYQAPSSGGGKKPPVPVTGSGVKK